MKKLFTTALLSLVFAGAVSAQGISAGLRTGTSCWMQRASGHSFKFEPTQGQKRSLDAEIFVRWETKGRWAFEGGLGGNSLQTEQTTQAPTVHNGELLGYTTTRRSGNKEVRLSAQYEIICSSMKTYPLMKRFRSYAGISVIPTLTDVNESIQRNTAGTFPSYISNDETDFEIWTGLSHTMIFAVTPHFNISSLVQGSIAPGELFDKSPQAGEAEPSKRMSFRFGVGYRL